MGRELSKGEASHDLSRFLRFGKEGALRGREFGNQIHTFSCLSVLHNAVVTWNALHIGAASRRRIGPHRRVRPRDGDRDRVFVDIKPRDGV